MPQPLPEERVQAAIAELDQVRRQWLRRPGVTAVDVGYRITGDELTDQLAIRAHVERKLPSTDVSEQYLFTSPDEPRMLGEFPVDVLEATYVPCHDPACTPARPDDADRRRSSTPLMGGLSVGSAGVTAGTLGAIVWDRSDGSAHILSNWHVLAVGPSGEHGQGCSGHASAAPHPYYHAAAAPHPYYHAAAAPHPYYHSAAAPHPYYHAAPHPYYHAVPHPYYHAAPDPGTVYQPGLADGGTPADSVAILSRSRLDHVMDAALARIDGPRPYLRDLLGLDPIAGVDEARLGMRVVKSGRTTGVTEGLVDGVSLSTTITYAHGAQAFEDQVHIVPRPPWPKRGHVYEVSDAGDSGAVWIDEGTRMAVGLNFAGERDPHPASEHALANPMTRVAGELDFTFTPLICRSEPAPPPSPRTWGPPPHPQGWPGATAELQRLRAAIDAVLDTLPD